MKSNHFKNRIPVFKLKNLNLGAPLFFPHGLRTPNEGINQRNLKIWADVQTKYASAVPKNLGVRVDFGPCSEGYCLTRRP